MDRDFQGIWIPKDIWLSRDLGLIDKNLLAEIISLDTGPNHCYASNAHFEDIFGVSTDTITRSINKLKKLGYIHVSYANGDRRSIQNLFKPTKTPPPENADTPPQNQEVPSAKSGGTLRKIRNVEYKENTERKQKEIQASAEALAVAKYLIDEHRLIDPLFVVGKESQSIERWAVDIDKIHTIDKRDWMEIKAVMTWCQRSWWSKNILSGAKFREKFPQLFAGWKTQSITQLSAHRDNTYRAPAKE